MIVRDVELPGAGGVTLRGLLHLPTPASSTALPAVVMAHGFSAVKEMGLPAYAEAFAAAGFAVLLYDHRNLGASDGEPRQEINPWAQARDYRHALGWLAAHPRVDPDRVALWGSSYSSGGVLVVAAIDDRVAAVVANVPFVGGRADPDAVGPDPQAALEAVRSQILDESGDGLADRCERQLGPLPVVDAEGGPCFLEQPESAEWFLRVGGRPGSAWQNSFTLCNGFGTAPPFDPGICIPHIAPTPLLMVVAREDRVAPADLAFDAFARAGEPKRLEVVEGHHFLAYEGETRDRVVEATVAFLRDAL